jgi:hypothetical protein
MTSLRRLARVAMFLGLGLLLADAARADIRPDPLTTGGGTPVVKGTDGTVPVVMRWEEVDLYPSPDRNRVVAVFGLHNPSKDTVRFEVGFPSYFENKLHGFTVEVDGEKQPAELKREKQPGGRKGKSIFKTWMCWPMTFAPDQEVRVRVSYWCEVEEGFEHLYLEKLPQEIKERIRKRKSGYVLRTGADWAQTIGKATIRLHYSAEVRKGGLTFVPSKGRKRQGGRGSAGAGKSPKATWTYDAEADVDTLILRDFEPTAASDIQYEFSLVSRQQEAELLLAALEQKRLDPWAMKHVLELVEKHNVFELDAAARDARAVRILEQMVPPRGPTFAPRGPGGKGRDEGRNKRYLSAGAEKVLREAFGRLIRHGQKSGQPTESVRAAYRAFLEPMVLRGRARFEKHPDKKKGWGWKQHQRLEQEWESLAAGR